jgi:hypothetical protein
MIMIRLPTQSNPPPFPRQTLPTMYDLPSDNPEDPGLPDEFHFFQPLLLLLTFQPTNWNWEQVFSACDLNLYYDVNHTHWYKRPDWFGVVGIPRLYEQRDLRLSYVIWQEEISPFVVVELLSPGTEDEDLGQTVLTSLGMMRVSLRENLLIHSSLISPCLGCCCLKVRISVSLSTHPCISLSSFPSNSCCAIAADPPALS